jgi:hypothetical protein
MEGRLYFNTDLLWTRLVGLILGVWLIATPLTFGQTSHLMYCSDLISGLLLVLFSLLSMRPDRFWAPWAVCLVGVWLQMAPLLFWAPDALSYLNDTLVGALAIAFSILIPGTPGERIRDGLETPPGWSYNPSSWHQRLPIVFFGFVGWFLARYMAAYQLGYTDHIVDPVFGDGTLRVITSDVSQAFPVSDAGLGAVAYTLEALMGAKGGSRRWYSMPWIVILFGILVVPLGFTSIVLVILQPLLVGAWCFWCLLAAICMLVMISLTVDEVVAVCQYLAQVRREGLPFWQIFWKGGDLAGSPDKLPPLNGSLLKTVPEMVRGVNVPWNLLLCVLLGLWTLFSTPIFHQTGAASDNSSIFGALVVAVSVIAMAEVARALRYFNMLFGIWLAFQPWLLEGSTMAGRWNGLICGILIVLLSLRRGAVRHQYGRWDRCIF